MRKFAFTAVLTLILGVTPGQAQTGGICFRNEINAGLIVQGASVVNQMPRRGQPILLAPKRVGWDNNVPGGVRYITIYDASQPTRILLHNFPVAFQGKDVFYSILPHPTQHGRVVLVAPAP